MKGALFEIGHQTPVPLIKLSVRLEKQVGVHSLHLNINRAYLRLITML